jgi:molybdate transport system substrate-binding protein
MTSARHLLRFILTVLLTVKLAYAADVSPPMLVFGAASLTNALDELGAAYTAQSAQQVKFSYAASSTLARQIEAGAKADIFFSADVEWMDYLQARNLIATATRINLLGNKLVLIAPADSKAVLKIVPNFALAAALGKGRLATGDPDSVPVGKYARSALTNLGVWNDIADKLVRADSVRTALAFVDRGEAPFGIVYMTDALIDKKVRIVDEFPASTHAAIVYPIALTTSAGKGADAFIAFLRGPMGQAAFKKYGFVVLP